MKKPAEDLQNNYLEAPPPYHQVSDPVIFSPPNVFNPTVPSPAPAPIYPENMAAGGQPVSQLDTILCQHDRFILQQVGTVGCFSEPSVIQIQDGNRQLIMSTVLDTGIIVGSGKHSVHTGSKVNFLSASGNSLMTVTETAQSRTVESGNRVLGLIDCTSWCRKLIPKSIAGLPICSLVKDPSDSFYTFFGSNGNELGKAGYLSEPGTYEVRLSSSVDPMTKPILLATGYFIYEFFYKETVCRPIGSCGVGKRWCICVLLMAVVFFLIALALTMVLSVSSYHNYNNTFMDEIIL